MTTFATRLRSTREALGLSQAECSRRADLRPATWCEIESGKQEPSLSTMERMAGALGVKLADLLR